MSLSDFCKKENSIWISASAGTGKTRALVTRVISLILQEVPIEKILCVTFTNNAAYEMKIRVNSVVCHLLSLNQDLFIAHVKDEYDLEIKNNYHNAATKLIDIINHPEKLRIYTIHAFCLELVKSYPFELGLNPGFSIISERQQKQIISSALDELIMELYLENKPLLEIITTNFKDQRLHDEIVSGLKHKEKIKNYQATSINKLTLEELKNNIKKLQLEFLNVIDRFYSMIKGISELRDDKFIESIIKWMEQNPTDKVANFQGLQHLLLTKENKPRKTTISKKLQEAFTDIALEITKLQEQMQILHDNASRLENVFFSEAMLSFLNKLFMQYEKKKKIENLLDFDDIIKLSSNLLSKSQFSNWVLYKLDYKFDHILVDEAQDTNHMQWEIITKISEEYFCGLTAKNQDRSIFVVGDTKQSIFGFQGAQPECFSYYEELYKNQIIEEGQKDFLKINLKKSYRSASSIINFANHLFAKYFQDEESQELLHEINHTSRMGRIELWPIIHDDEMVSAEKKLALSIAKEISDWLASSRLLASSDKVVEPRDIMILIRKRGKLYTEIIKALSEFNIPNSGEDRYEIKQSLFIKDLIACANFALFPEDDLTCASLLRSPFIEMDDQTLEDICVDRKQSLYLQCNNQFLRSLIESKDFKVREFYFNIIFPNIEKYLPYHGINLKTLISQFIGLIDQFEKENISNLQIFIDWISGNDFEIKKEQDFAIQEVKIITAHSSKGLESKIVILPDTIHNGSKTNRFVMTDDKLFFSLNKLSEGAHQMLQREREESEEFREYIRLLYVSVTRAENELYIMGASGSETLPLDCWYNIIQDSFLEIATKYGDKYIYGEERLNFPKEGLQRAHKPSAKKETGSIKHHYLLTKTPTLDEFNKISPYDNDFRNMEIGREAHNIITIYPSFISRPDIFQNLIRALYPLASKEIKLELIDNFFTGLSGAKLLNEIAFIELKSQNSSYKVKYRGSIDMLALYQENIVIYEFKSKTDLKDKYNKQMGHYYNILSHSFTALKIDAKFFWISSGIITKFDPLI